MEGSSSFRVFHIVESLDRGAVENWLVNVFIESRKLRPEWSWTFFCLLSTPGRLDDKVRANGGRIIYSAVPISRKLDFLRGLRRALVADNYDVIHAHHDFLSGYYMLSSLGLSSRKIIHVHNNDEGFPVGSSFLRKLLVGIFRETSLLIADDIVAISKYTLKYFVKGRPVGRTRLQVLYYGIDLEKFSREIDEMSFRRKHGLGSDSVVLLFVGRMIPEKNPLFVLDVLKELDRENRSYHALFVGNGELQDLIHDKARQLGLGGKVHVLGWQSDIAEVMVSSDVFLFPRLLEPKEGLGLVVVEAQVAGLPVFVTDGIVDDAVILKDDAFKMSLDHPAEWAKCICDRVKLGRKNRYLALQAMRDSCFSIQNATLNFISLYEGNRS